MSVHEMSGGFKEFKLLHVSNLGMIIFALITLHHELCTLKCSLRLLFQAHKFAFQMVSRGLNCLNLFSVNPVPSQ